MNYKTGTVVYIFLKPQGNYVVSRFYMKWTFLWDFLITMPVLWRFIWSEKLVGHERNSLLLSLFYSGPDSDIPRWVTWGIVQVEMVTQGNSLPFSFTARFLSSSATGERKWDRTLLIFMFFLHSMCRLTFLMTISLKLKIMLLCCLLNQHISVKLEWVASEAIIVLCWHY